MKDEDGSTFCKPVRGTLLLVDDHILFAEGLRLLLAKRGLESNIAHAHSAEEGLRIAAESAYIELVLLDLSLPGLRGSESIQAFRQALPNAPVIVLTGSEEEGIEALSRNAGATDFIHKSRSPESMLGAIAPYLQGGLKSNTRSADLECLTRRQREVMLQLGRGLSNKQIARELQVSDNTVRVHLHDIFRLLGVDSRTEAALIAVDRREWLVQG